MRPPSKLILVAALAWNCAFGAALPSEWQFHQSFEVKNAGLVKLELPPATLGKSRPDLEDLRLFSSAGSETPYLIERPRPARQTIHPAKSFQPSLVASSTVIEIETGSDQPIDGVTLETPAVSFIKGVQVDGSNDRNRWKTIAKGQPIFRQPNGASHLHLPLQPRRWAWLRITMDDRRSQPVPFTGARIHAAAPQAPPVEFFTAPIIQRHENPGESRLVLNLGAANLDIAAIHIETTEPLFTRAITIAVPQVSNESLTEQLITQGSIFRADVEGQPVAGVLRISIEHKVPSGELLVLVRNVDSPPLPITGVRVERRPAYLLFNAREPGTFTLLTGNPSCAAPRYDLAGLGPNLRAAAVSKIALPPAELNPNFRAPEVLPGLPQDGALLELSSWKYRKPVTLTRGGAQFVELDVDVLANAQRSFGDIRLVRDGKQVPYVLEQTSIVRSLAPAVTVTNDVKDRAVSRWLLQLPRPGLPVNRLSCAPETPLFQRDMSFYEPSTDERGASYRRHLGSTTWLQTPERRTKELVYFLPGGLTSDTLVVETHNGDNPPIQLGAFRMFYSATRLHFKAASGESLFIYYGNPNAARPNYDISLVAWQLLAADKGVGELGNQEQLRRTTWAESRRRGVGGILFWGVLALVVTVLLAVMGRLLPKVPPPSA